MKKFKITTIHNIYLDSYDNGEQEQVNFYSLEKDIEALTAMDAIEEYFKTFLYYKITRDQIEIDLFNNEILATSVLVNADNVEASKNEINKWVAGNLKLYSNRIDIMVDELKPVKF